MSRILVLNSVYYISTLHMRRNVYVCNESFYIAGSSPESQQDATDPKGHSLRLAGHGGFTSGI